MTEEKLIEAVRNHQELYDTQHANYMKTKLKSRIWSDIAKNLNLKDGEEAKNSWLKLRGSYRDARRRKKKYMKSGAAPEHIKPWKFQNQMSFLEPFMSTGSREGNLVDADYDDLSLSPEPSIRESLENQDMGTSRGENKGSSQLDPVLIDAEIAYAEQSIDDPLPLSAPVTQTKKKKKCNDDFRGLLNRSLQMREERTRQRAEERNKILDETKSAEDPMYNFFITMYQLTKTMPPNFKHWVRTQVFQIVSDAETEIMRSDNTTFHDSSTSGTTARYSPYPSTSSASSTSSHPPNLPTNPVHRETNYQC